MSNKNFEKNVKLTAYKFVNGCKESVELSEVMEHVMRGEIIILPRCLQGINYFNLIQEASIKAIHDSIGEEKANRVKNEGFEAIHKIIDLEELNPIVDSSYQTFRSLAPELSTKLVKEVLQIDKNFYCEESPNVRFHIPYDTVFNRKEEFNQFYWNGKVTAHGPHHDSWYYCPTNCFNIWIALGQVKIGNGLSFYPQAYGKRLPCTDKGKILKDQYFGKAINFELEPGDAIIFHGEHLHSSEINSTDATRYVVSFRMTIDKPKYLGKSPYRHNYVYRDTREGLRAKFNQFINNTFRRIVKKSESLLEKSENRNYIISASEHQNFNDTSLNFPKVLKIKEFKESFDENTKLNFNPSELAIGSIKPLSDKLAIARLDRDRVVVFSRYCPHEGADLAAGYLRDRCVVCPWHNLPFNMESGASPCESLRHLKVNNYIYSSDNNEWELESVENESQSIND